MNIKYILRRLFAFYFDAFISLIITLIIIYILSLLGVKPLGIHPTLYQLLILMLYLFFCEYFFNKTLGKKILGLKIIVKNSTTIKNIFIRTISRLIPFDMISIFFTSKNLMWHDKFSNTKVEVTKKSDSKVGN